MKVTVPAMLIAVALLVGHLYYGLGYALGPSRLSSSGSFAVALTWFTQQQWGWLIAGGALLTIVAPLAPPWRSPWWSIACHVAASLPLLAFSAGIGLAEFYGLAQGWGGVGTFGTPVLGHALLVHARYRHGRTPRVT